MTTGEDAREWKARSKLLGAAPFALVLVVWCGLSYGGIVQELFLPSPTATLSESVRLFTEEHFHRDVLVSLARVAVGFMLSTALAVPLGILMGASRSWEAAMLPFVSFLRYMPPTAFIPLAILWFGIGFSEHVFLVFLSIFFYLVLLIADAAGSVRTSLIETAKTLGATRPQLILNVVFPAASPAIWQAMRTMFGVGWVMIVVVELIGAETGVGAKIIHAQRFLQTPTVFAGICIIGAIGLLCDVLFRVVHRLLFPWT